MIRVASPGRLGPFFAVDDRYSAEFRHETSRRSSSHYPLHHPPNISLLMVNREESVYVDSPSYVKMHCPSFPPSLPPSSLPLWPQLTGLIFSLSLISCYLNLSKYVPVVQERKLTMQSAPCGPPPVLYISSVQVSFCPRHRARRGIRKPFFMSGRLRAL